MTLEYEPPIPEIEPDPAYTLAVEAAAGEENRLRVMRDDRGFVVRETGTAPLSAGERCSSTAPGEVVCGLLGEASHLSVFVDADDEADVVVVRPLGGIDLAEVARGIRRRCAPGPRGSRTCSMAGAGQDVVAGEDADDRTRRRAG